MGRDWGQDLRREVVTWEKFQTLLKTVVLPAAQTDQQAFRRGFTETYGSNADAAFEKAWQEMQGVLSSPVPSTAEPNTPLQPGLPPAVETK